MFNATTWKSDAFLAIVWNYLSLQLAYIFLRDLVGLLEMILQAFKGEQLSVLF